MASSIAVDQFPQPALPFLATATTAGAMPANNLTAAQMNILSADAAAGARGTVLIGTYTAAGEAYYDFFFASNGYRRLRMIWKGVYSAVPHGVAFQPDGSDTGCSAFLQYNIAATDTTSGTVNDPGSLATANFGGIRSGHLGGVADAWKLTDGTWLVDGKSYSKDQYGHARFVAVMPGWANHLRINAVGTIFVAGGVFALYGEPDAVNVPNPIAATTDVNAATYTATLADRILMVRRTLTGACTITLPVGVAGAPLLVVDSGEMAVLNNITLVAQGGQTVDGGASILISLNGDSRNLIFDGIRNNWKSL